MDGNGSHNPLGTIFTIILFALLIVSPMVIAGEANAYVKTFYVRDEVKDYLEDAVVEGVTENNYLSFINKMSAFGYTSEIGVTRNGIYYTEKELLEVLRGAATSDLIAELTSDDRLTEDERKAYTGKDKNNNDREYRFALLIGDMVEITVSDGKSNIYKSQIIGEN